MRNDSRRRLTPLAVAVLRLLQERDMHPYEMYQVIQDRCTDRVIKVRPGSLYHTVEHLARHGMIEAVQTARAGRRPERTVYAVTETGRDEFRAALREMVRSPEPGYPLFAAAVEMLPSLEADEAVRLLERRTVALEASLAAQEQVATALMKRGLSRLHLIEAEYARAMVRAEMRWIGDLIDEIKTGSLPWRPSPDGPPGCGTDIEETAS